MRRARIWVVAVWAGCAVAANSAEPRFLSFGEASEVLSAFGRTEDHPAWDAWVRQQDREVRGRIDRGVEDSISNLIAYGNSFTRLPRLESPEAAVNREGELVEAGAGASTGRGRVYGHTLRSTGGFDLRANFWRRTG
jgi:hypothetical protein